MPTAPLPLIISHPRTWRDSRFVYPVLSRRSGGISIGINLNPDKVCNFDCIYCQVDRRSEAETRFVETERMLAELETTLDVVTSGVLYEDEQFRGVPERMRRLNDIAFSGDGEPTTHRNFDEVVEQVAAIKRRRNLESVKLVLITNASMLHRPHVQAGMAVLDENNGEIWAKLDAGTDAYYQLVERTKVPFRQVLDNIAQAARGRPIVMQSLFMRIQDDPPSPDEIDAYCDRLNEITSAGGAVRLVQIYTVARPPAESFVSPLTREELDAVASKVAARTGLAVDVFPGSA